MDFKSHMFQNSFSENIACPHEHVVFRTFNVNLHEVAATYTHPGEKIAKAESLSALSSW